MKPDNLTTLSDTAVVISFTPFVVGALAGGAMIYRHVINAYIFALLVTCCELLVVLCQLIASIG